MNVFLVFAIYNEKLVTFTKQLITFSAEMLKFNYGLILKLYLCYSASVLFLLVVFETVSFLMTHDQ